MPRHPLALLLAALLPSGAAPATAPAADPVLDAIRRADEETLAGRGSSYDAAGRRDPFVDPLGAEVVDAAARPPGLAGMRFAELRLQGLLVDGGEPIALFLGTDGMGHSVREGDALADGVVVAVDFAAGRVAFQQRVEDPRSPLRHRLVERRLAPSR